MGRRIGALAMAGVALWSSGALAAQWATLPGEKVSIDMASIAHDADKSVAWVLFDLVDPQAGEGEPAFRSIRTKMQADCKTRGLRMVEMEFYDGPTATGTVVHTRTFDEPFEAPGNETGQRTVELMCAANAGGQ